MGLLGLPDGYFEIKKIRIQEDKKFSTKLNICVFVIATILLGIGIILFPFSVKHFKVTENTLINRIILIFVYLSYLPFHELIHGAAVTIMTKKRAKYGFTGLYVYAGNEAYLNKTQYIIYVISPVVILGCVFLTFNIILSKEYFWTIYILQIINLSCSAGDYYLAALTSKMPTDTLIQDKGLNISMYSRSK